jgi:Fe2+ or Zn2+ uptake regulation protein
MKMYDIRVIANHLQQGKMMIETITRLRSQGGRLTVQRRLILDTLESFSGHPTAEELYAAVKKKAPKLHLSTVYRTIRWLEHEGKVSARRFEEDNGQERFDYTPSEHHHFQCSKCKRVIEFDSPLVEEVKKNFEEQTRVSVETASLVFYGTCNVCHEQTLDKRLAA